MLENFMLCWGTVHCEHLFIVLLGVTWMQGQQSTGLVFLFKSSWWHSFIFFSMWSVAPVILASVFLFLRNLINYSNAFHNVFSTQSIEIVFPDGAHAFTSCEYTIGFLLSSLFIRGARLYVCRFRKWDIFYRWSMLSCSLSPSRLYYFSMHRYLATQTRCVTSSLVY